MRRRPANFFPEAARRTRTGDTVVAYLVVEITGVSDEAGLGRYIEQVGGLVARHGGRYLARGPVADILEGGHRPLLLGVLEFPSVEAIRALYGDPAYAPFKALRQASCNANFLTVEGLKAV
jgi:uncharacterized protein (DUF1330 family)